jgi:hypothetical protein
MMTRKLIDQCEDMKGNTIKVGDTVTLTMLVKSIQHNGLLDGDIVGLPKVPYYLHRLHVERVKQAGIPNAEWKGQGFCNARHIRNKDDFCNDPVIGLTRPCCEKHTCSVVACFAPAVVYFPLLGERRCALHKGI